MGCFSKNHFLENTNKKPANRLGGDRTKGGLKVD